MDWIKLCAADSGQCLEVAKQEGHVFLRNTDSPGSIVELTEAEWTAAKARLREDDSI